jgi:hypothetical protein
LGAGSRPPAPRAREPEPAGVDTGVLGDLVAGPRAAPPPPAAGEPTPAAPPALDDVDRGLLDELAGGDEQRQERT